MQMKEEQFDLDEFKKIVQRHVRACEYFGKFSDLYAPSLIMKYSLIAITICLNGFMLLEVRKCCLKFIVCLHNNFI